MKMFLTVLEFCLPFCSAVLGALLSYFIASKTAKNEIEKTKLTFSHDDFTALNTAFSLLMEKTAYCCHAQNSDSYNSALNANASYMCLTDAKIKPILKKLDTALFDRNTSEIKDLRQQIFEQHSQHIKKAD